MPVEHPTLRGIIRDAGRRPTPEEDPFNAIARRCSVKGASTGKLAGMRLGLKENISVAGIPLTCGSRVLSGYVPEVDATVVTRLLSEGGEIVAMLNMDDMARSWAGDTCAYGPGLNPHNPQHLAGGSSSGSASALYYDYVDATLGCDQGGSIRTPASWCGVVGLKPTFGLVPYTGIISGEPTIDHVGPMARTTEKVALVLDVIAGKDPLDPRQNEVPVEGYAEALDSGVKGIKLGILKEGFGLRIAEKAVDSKVCKAINQLGIEVGEASVPAHVSSYAVHQAVAIEGGRNLLRDHGLGYGWQGFYDTSLAEVLGRSLKTQADDLPAEAKSTLLFGAYLDEHHHGRTYAKIQNLRRNLRSAYDSALARFDVLAMPTEPVRAFKYDPGASWKTRIKKSSGVDDNTAAFNVTGHPAISIPCGKIDGLPVGLSLVAKHFNDAVLLRIAHAFEHAVDWETL